jgi:transcriptional regulator with XRE-family HTH domain
LADRVRQARIQLGWKQTTLSTRAGVTLGSLRRFEQTGEISLKHLLRLVHALGRLDELDLLLKPAPSATLAELEARISTPIRKRGSR